MDVAIGFNENGSDFEILNNDLLTENSLLGAVVVSLFTDRRAEDTDPLPEGETERRGWWGNSLEQDENIGSLLWLIHREKATQAVRLRAQSYCEKALEWIITEGIASSVKVESEYTSGSVLAINIQISRGDDAQYAYLWEDLKNVETTIKIGNTELSLEIF